MREEASSGESEPSRQEIPISEDDEVRAQDVVKDVIRLLKRRSHGRLFHRISATRRAHGTVVAHASSGGWSGAEQLIR